MLSGSACFLAEPHAWCIDSVRVERTIVQRLDIATNTDTHRQSCRTCLLVEYSCIMRTIILEGTFITFYMGFPINAGRLLSRERTLPGRRSGSDRLRGNDTRTMDMWQLAVERGTSAAFTLMRELDGLREKPTQEGRIKNDTGMFREQKHPS